MTALSAHVRKQLRDMDLDVSISCRAGEITALVGPSGAGKTTLMRILAGLERPDRGMVALGENIWSDTRNGTFLPPRLRRLGYVFQEYSLFPHLNLERNVGFATGDKTRVKELMQRLEIWELRRAKPSGVSGGERQRTALAQALAREPRVLLLDEPCSSVDPVTKNVMHQVISQAAVEHCIPVVLVTHDLAEASELSGAVHPIRKGRICPEWLDTATACLAAAP